MTGGSRSICGLASRLLEYPDADFFSALPACRAEIADTLSGADDESARNALLEFLDRLASYGDRLAQEKYVAVFDHDPAASLYLSWHRYGNDRSQGKAMIALNGLYRAAGFEPVPGVMPDYLPRVLEFVGVCEDWAVEVVLDGFGPELDALATSLTEQDSDYGLLLKTAIAPLRAQWPQHFKPRKTPDPTARPMAQAKPLLEPLMPLDRDL